MIHRLTMIAKVIVAFCIFQVAFGQDDPETSIRTFVTEVNAEANNYINPLVQRMIAFGNSFGDEDRQLQDEYTTLRTQLETLAAQSTGANDPTICLNVALEDAYNIYQDRADQLSAFHTVQFNDLNQIFNELALVDQEQQSFVTETEDSIQTCNSLSSAAEVQACLETVFAPLDEMATDILNRFEEIRVDAEDLLTTAESEMENLNSQNRAFVSQSQQQTTQDFNTCLGA